MRLRDTRWSEMDHVRLDENQVADLYLMGKLDEAERLAFEEHFVDCSECLERIEAVEGLRGALKELPAGRSEAASSLRPFARRVRPLVLLLAAACVVMATAASLFYSEARRTRRELEAVRQASEKSRQRQVELDANLPRERTLSSAPGSAVSGALAALPLAATVFTLDVTRSVSSEPGNRILLPDPAGWLVLLVDRPNRTDLSRLRIRLSTSGGRSVMEPIAPGTASGGMLAVGLSSTLLPPGDYLFAVEDSGSSRVLATYRFRSAARRP